MNIIELSKAYCMKSYNGNYQEMIDKKDGIIFDDKTIKAAFNAGNGTEKDLQRYIECNKRFCRFYNLDRGMYI